MKDQHVVYKTNGYVCSKTIEFDVKDDRVYNVKFIGGCRGNTQGVAALAEGMAAEEIVDRLAGICCKEQNSCPNEFATAVKGAMEQ